MQIRLLRNLAAFLTILAILQNGCATNGNSTAEQYCIDSGGHVVTEMDTNGFILEMCAVTETVQFDDGDFDFTRYCELQSFLEGRCEEEATADAQNHYGTSTDTASGTVRDLLYERADRVLSKLKNTGYSHRPFSLRPDYDGADTAETFNLFIDCSGFVGAYVVRGISPKLYDQLPRKYSCGPLTEEAGVITLPARPLAADFADFFKDAETVPQVSDDNVAHTSDLPDDVCWGRVMHIADARRGDVLVYYHEENINLHTRYCCHKDGNVYKTREMTADDICSDGRVIYKMKCKNDTCSKRKNSGHVLFVMERPYLSSRCKDNMFGCGIYQYLLPGNFQWVVKVADSTTSPHTYDSRHLGANRSDYKINFYTAWEKGEEGYLERCNDGSYQRSCGSDVGLAEKIYLDTDHKHTPTGIGAGIMYVNDGMDGYRTAYGVKTEASKVFLGRPVRCP